MGTIKKVYGKVTEDSDYKLKMENDEKRSLYIKAKNVVKDVKVKKYLADRNEISKEGLSIFGLFSGKNHLQVEKLRNIKLKIELLETEKIKEKAKYEAADILAELYSCAMTELSGKFTPEMKDMYDYVKTKYCDENITDSDISYKASTLISKESSNLPVLHSETVRGVFANTKVQIDFYKLENLRLQNQIMIERGKSQLDTFPVEGNKIVPLKGISIEN